MPTVRSVARELLTEAKKKIRGNLCHDGKFVPCGKGSVAKGRAAAATGASSLDRLETALGSVKIGSSKGGRYGAVKTLRVGGSKYDVLIDRNGPAEFSAVILAPRPRGLHPDKQWGTQVIGSTQAEMASMARRAIQSKAFSRL